MRTINHPGLRGLTLGLAVLVLAGFATQADEPETQTITADGLTFEAPADWKSSQPSSAMRKAQLEAPPVEGEDQPAELVVFAFPGGAGTVRANVERWQNQFRDADGRRPEITSETVEGRNVEVIRVEIETPSRYTDPFSTADPQENFRLLGAIVQTPRIAYFLKMVGPDRTMAAARDDFDALVKSIAVAE